MNEAEKMHNKIKENVDDLYSNKIDYAEFHKRAIKLWDEVTEKNLVESVDDLINKDLWKNKLIKSLKKESLALKAIE